MRVSEVYSSLLWGKDGASFLLHGLVIGLESFLMGRPVIPNSLAPFFPGWALGKGLMEEM